MFWAQDTQEEIRQKLLPSWGKQPQRQGRDGPGWDLNNGACWKKKKATGNGGTRAGAIENRLASPCEPRLRPGRTSHTLDSKEACVAWPDGGAGSQRWAVLPSTGRSAVPGEGGRGRLLLAWSEWEPGGSLVSRSAERSPLQQRIIRWKDVNHAEVKNPCGE